MKYFTVIAVTLVIAIVIFTRPSVHMVGGDTKACYVVKNGQVWYVQGAVPHPVKF